MLVCTPHLASSALVKRIIALADFTNRLLMISLNFVSSALEGTFSCTAMQIFLLLA